MVPTISMFRMVTPPPLLQTSGPTVGPTNVPIIAPTKIPTVVPTKVPTFFRMSEPSTLPTAGPTTLNSTQTPTQPRIESKLSSSGSTSKTQNSSNTIIIVVVLSIVVVTLLAVACYCVNKKTPIKQQDAYQKWTRHYENKAAPKQPEIENTAAYDDMYHFYSKNNSPNTTFSPYISTRQSQHNSRRGPQKTQICEL